MTEKLKKCLFCNRKLVRTVNTYKNSYGKDVNEDFYSHDVTKYPERCPAEEIIVGNNEKDIQAWNTRATDENPPLTLDELFKMDGEAVWCEATAGTSKWWDVISNPTLPAGLRPLYLTDGRLKVKSSVTFKDYGKTWLAYRRKPEDKEIIKKERQEEKEKMNDGLIRLQENIQNLIDAGYDDEIINGFLSDDIGVDLNDINNSIETELSYA